MTKLHAADRIRSATGRAVAPVAISIVLGVLLLGVNGCDSGGDEDARESAAVPSSEWNDPPGRWHRTHDGRLTDEQQAEIERLETIGYLAGSTEAPDVAGVTIRAEGAYEGLNFYTSGHFPGAILMDMDGNILHSWRFRFIDAWEAGPRGELPRKARGAGYWRRAHLFENGDVLAIFEGLGLIKVNKDSELIWAYLEGVHHDLDVWEDGTIYVLTRDAHVNPEINPDEPVLEDYVVVLDARGRELRRVSLYDAFAESKFSVALQGMATSGDIFHTNTIEVLDGTHVGTYPHFARGRVLFCVREIEVVGILDLDLEKVVWAIEQPWEKPHDPRFIRNGNMMIFDNMGYWGGSRIVEFNPLTMVVEWTYQGEEPQDFASKECGTSQRLPNGNTLITESDRGRAFEVKPDGAIVWEYVNPAHAGEHNDFIATIFDMVRIESDYPGRWLERRPRDVASSR